MEFCSHHSSLHTTLSIPGHSTKHPLHIISSKSTTQSHSVTLATPVIHSFTIPFLASPYHPALLCSLILLLCHPCFHHIMFHCLPYPVLSIPAISDRLASQNKFHLSVVLSHKIITIFSLIIA